ncbi:hypothetical protein EVA_09035 [gut metagenome]|uniref:Uncharacterized protein n=1 Tax=gut metagenome TaxID=749906 RepID=J9CRP5_9ZZZZ
MMGPNGTVLKGNFTQEYQQTTLPTTNVAVPAWAQGPLTSATSVIFASFCLQSV